ncbi:MAG: hypothetical protein A2513_01925 [Sulfurimonas sp. RIFOXYD12_FULL_33_39]|uniref:hypothetical protein n=1 Tax=unclassified Sulfurimonas TaxID=2623549 RepID=UPI0008AB9286|nr:MULTISPECIES: hypothetical protein [unclassified Sulfurimonas]OHE04024.1 MAG: hypothetical protein A3G74_00765 [Sulfurimonas sp. RIFCSPLOWO2_12_FULL_34_6]OHE08753.1 MAG: hypothetical protein A2513_01925 [Sulfurimonas sp. RIFOXYD12_FULL_33_39]OHE14038.1 MAG: hypothetical protein A2530_03250 [Sulfurimonas sp. RIFOXYD2_FULL_34_21]DAB27644.1 MAG TPA: hypothetical protein CFH78_06770 [Sulfurimonas sp. UBA10385]
MAKYLLITLAFFLFVGCANRTGISAKYYANECSEYYDVQGYYHKDCKDENIVSYEEIGKKANQVVEFIVGEEEKKEEKPKGNVW